MAAVQRIIDIAEDAVAVRRRRRRALFRLGIPILGVTLVVVAIFVIALYSYAANRRGAVALSDDLLDTLDAQIAQRVAAFLDPCERALRIMREVAADVPLIQRRASDERFATATLKELPQIAAFYVGDSAGNFLMVRRHDDGVQTKQIINQPGDRSVVLIDRNAAGAEVARREDPTDDYDPRTEAVVPGRRRNRRCLLDRHLHLLQRSQARRYGLDPRARAGRVRPRVRGRRHAGGVVAVPRLAGDRRRWAGVDHGRQGPGDRGAELGEVHQACRGRVRAAEGGSSSAIRC